MSNNLEKVIQRAISDAAFRRQLQSNPEAALRGVKLASEEVAALRSGDAGRLTSLGIDQRMSKVFAIPDMQFASRPSAGIDVGSGAAITDDDSSRFSGAANANLTGDSNAIIADPTSGVRGVADIQPFGDPANPVTDPNASSDALEDQSHAFAATHSGDIAMGAAASALRNTEPVDLGGSVATDDDAGAMVSRLRNTEPVDLGSSAATDDDAGASISRVRDSEPLDLGGSTVSAAAARDAPASELEDYEPTFHSGGYQPPIVDANAAADAIEDQSHAFSATRSSDIEAGTVASNLRNTEPVDLSSAHRDAFLSAGEASQYQVDPNASADSGEDISHAFNPVDATALPDGAEQGHGDALGNTGQPDSDA